jgi:TPR repeat protein
LLNNDAGAKVVLHANREVAGGASEYYFYARLPQAVAMTTSSRCRRDTREGLKSGMALFARSRNRAHEAELQERVHALQSALDQCKGVARQWWSMRVRFTVAVALIAMSAGFALGVYRHSIKQAFVDSAAAVGLASPQGDGAAEADAAFQKGDYAKALRLARPLAEAGDPRAESTLGFAYYRGRGVAQSDSEAAKWFQLAADKGNAASRFTLGVMYGEGRGVPQDFAEAARWYRRAAEQGDAQAQYNLGLAYARGEGVTQNVVDAHVWFNLAAARFPASDSRNRTAAVKNRDTVAGEMTSDQLAEAQKRAREWKPQ